MEDPHRFRLEINEKLTEFVRSLGGEYDLSVAQENMLVNIDRFVCSEIGIDINKFPDYD
mgnify:CR=1 FL=1|tara:strand:- start:579 stop:755 length:177 start_codon:yes stop_codon:yes gene_type:complete